MSRRRRLPTLPRGPPIRLSKRSQRLPAFFSVSFLLLSFRPFTFFVGASMSSWSRVLRVKLCLRALPLYCMPLRFRVFLCILLCIFWSPFFLLIFRYRRNSIVYILFTLLFSCQDMTFNETLRSGFSSSFPLSFYCPDYHTYPSSRLLLDMVYVIFEFFFAERIFLVR